MDPQTKRKPPGSSSFRAAHVNTSANRTHVHLAETDRFFRQGSVIVELIEYSEGLKLVELEPEAFRSRLESHFALRSFVMANNRQALRPKLCSQDNAKALLATEAALRYLPPIQAIVNSPVFTEDEAGELVLLNQGYHSINGVIYVLGKRNIDTSIETETAVKELLSILEDFSFLTESDKSRCVSGLISPALRFGCLLDTDFPLDRVRRINPRRERVTG